MSAAIERMMYVGEVPWHGIGTALPQAINSEEAIKVAGLDWEVEMAPIITHDQKHTSVDDWRVTRRITDNAILGVVKKSYIPIQNKEAFKMFDGVCGGPGKARFHTAGSLIGGSRIWMLAKLPDIIEVGKGIGSVDEVEKYLLLANAHDGSLQLQMLFTPVRVVCNNTLNMALYFEKEESEEEENLKNRWLKNAPRVTVHHGKNADVRMKEAEKVMRAALRYYEKFGDFANFLYGRTLFEAQVQNIIAQVFPPTKKMEITPAIVGHRTEVRRLFDEGKGHDRISGTAWALLNAFGEYADHTHAGHGKGGPEERSYSVWMGGAKGMKERATKTIFQALAA
jgi:phage/plasmid-like protein (TIGR03299 family)